MNTYEVKTTAIVCLTILLALALVVGGVLGNRYIRQQDIRTATEFSVSITLPEGFTCYTSASGESSG